MHSCSFLLQACGLHIITHAICNTLLQVLLSFQRQLSSASPADAALVLASVARLGHVVSYTWSEDLVEGFCAAHLHDFTSKELASVSLLPSPICMWTDAMCTLRLHHSLCCLVCMKCTVLLLATNTQQLGLNAVTACYELASTVPRASSNVCALQSVMHACISCVHDYESAAWL
jgi:hypothetical protein